jgi:pyruvate ferredoxin oxidoreductase gamma subunit/2-oxoisovalerate ferredoxin oxidoreductase gamma subunit
LINAPQAEENPAALERVSLASVDATAIALRHRLGTVTHPIINTAMVGALARMLGMPPLGAVAAAIREELPDAAEANVQASQDAYEQVVLPATPVSATGAAG